MFSRPDIIYSGLLLRKSRSESLSDSRLLLSDLEPWSFVTSWICITIYFAWWKHRKTKKTLLVKQRQYCKHAHSKYFIFFSHLIITGWKNKDGFSFLLCFLLLVFCFLFPSKTESLNLFFPQLNIPFFPAPAPPNLDSITTVISNKNLIVTIFNILFETAQLLAEAQYN